MDFSALKTALSNRGFARLGDTLLGEIINDARSELDDLENWPYLEASVTGTAPLAISDLKEVDQVFDQTSKLPLDKRSYAELVNDFGDLSVTGTQPQFWYKATPSGSPTVAVYPVSTRTIGVQYWKVSPVLSNSSDVPLAPVRYHQVIVLIAERMAHARKADLATAQALQVEVERAVQRMRESLTPDDAAVMQIITGGAEDW